MNWKLHPDQKDWCRATVDAFETGQHGEGPWKRLLSTAATGAGKTVMAAAIAGYALKRWHGPGGEPSRVLFLADTDELVQQAVDKFWDAAGLVVDKEKAADRASLASRTVVGSIQTLARDERLQRFPAGHFALVIADEAHLSMATTWQRVLGHFDTGGARSLGITATPERHDGKDLFKWWQHKPAEIGMFDLIAKGRLAPITVRTVPLELDCTGVHRDGAELDEEELTSAISPAFDAILDAWEEEGEGRKTLWFMPGIAASKEFTERLLARGHPALHVDGTSADRRQTLARFDTGEAMHLCNAQLLTKGYDQPDIGCVVILRATQSRVAYQQMVGRGTRTAPGKTDLLLLDFLWKFDELGICRPGDLVARTKEEARDIQREIERQGTIDLKEARELTDDQQVRSLVERLLANCGRQRRAYDAREIAALMGQPDLLRYEPEASWEQAPPTPKQLEILSREKISIPSVKNRGHASRLIEMILDRTARRQASIRQTLMLAAQGVPDPARLGRDEAGSLIEEIIAANQR